MTETSQFEERIRRLEDRVAIEETVITYARAIDVADWDLYRSIFTDPVHIDFSGAGMQAADFPRDVFVDFASTGLSGFEARQHLSPNHVIDFDDGDPDRAICHSYMYAPHYIKDAEGGDFYLMRGSYTNHMLRTAAGWKIERLIQHLSWLEGNRGLPEIANARATGGQS